MTLLNSWNGGKGNGRSTCGPCPRIGQGADAIIPPAGERDGHQGSHSLCSRLQRSGEPRGHDQRRARGRGNFQRLRNHRGRRWQHRWYGGACRCPGRSERGREGAPPSHEPRLCRGIPSGPGRSANALFHIRARRPGSQRRVREEHPELGGLRRCRRPLSRQRSGSRLAPPCSDSCLNRAHQRVVRFSAALLSGTMCLPDGAGALAQDDDQRLLLPGRDAR